jgi:AcrR family transcriptional regulator
MGPDSISFRELARRLGVTTAAPYYHFRDKEELLLQLAVEGFTKLLHRMEQAAKNEPSAERKMEAIVQVFLTFGRRERGYYGIMFHREVVQSHNIPILEGPAAKCFDVVCSIIAEISPESTVQEVHERALANWSFLHGMLQLSASGPLARRLPPEQENQFALRVCKIILGMK